MDVWWIKVFLWWRFCTKTKVQRPQKSRDRHMSEPFSPTFHSGVKVVMSREVVMVLSLSAIPVHNVSGNCTRSGICCVTCNFPAKSPTASSYWHIDAIATNNINNWKRDSYMSPPPTTTSLFTFTFPLFFTIFAISLSSSDTFFLLHNSTS